MLLIALEYSLINYKNVLSIVQVQLIPNKKKETKYRQR